MRELNGYVLSIDKDKIISILVDENENKAFHMECETKEIKEDLSNVTAEQKFILKIGDDETLNFNFINDKINKNVTLEDLKENLENNKDFQEDIEVINDYIKKGDD